MEKKNIRVNAASIVDLKAELYRKQREFKQEKLVSSNSSDAAKSKPKFLPKKLSELRKQNAGVAKRAAKDEKDAEQRLEEENSLEKSRKALEAKAALYEKMTAGNDLGPENDERAELYLVDFEKKAVDTWETQKIEDAKEEKDFSTEDIPAASPDEEWVEYVDALGRSRRCMRKDLDHYKRADRDLNPNFQEPERKPDLLSGDMMREMLRKKWEQEEEVARNRPNAPIHYENVRFDEIRDMGVAYYNLSKDEEQRKQQMEQLDLLREETTDQRERRGKLKARRKAAMQARLEKVKQRKKLKTDFTLEDDQEKVEEEEVEPLTRESIPATTEMAPLRPWDKGKDKLGLLEKRRRRELEEERPAEFAPPSLYYQHSTQQQPRQASPNITPEEEEEEEEGDQGSHAFGVGENGQGVTGRSEHGQGVTGQSEHGQGVTGWGEQGQGVTGWEEVAQEMFRPPPPPLPPPSEFPPPPMGNFPPPFYPPPFPPPSVARFPPPPHMYSVPPPGFVPPPFVPPPPSHSVSTPSSTLSEPRPPGTVDSASFEVPQQLQQPYQQQQQSDPISSALSYFRKQSENSK